jgi:hypothetical protein
MGITTLEFIPEDPENNVYRVTVAGNDRVNEKSFNKTGPGVWIKDFSHFADMGMEGRGDHMVADLEEGYDAKLTRNEHDQLVVETVEV